MKQEIDLLRKRVEALLKKDDAIMPHRDGKIILEGDKGFYDSKEVLLEKDKSLEAAYLEKNHIRNKYIFLHKEIKARLVAITAPHDFTPERKEDIYKRKKALFERLQKIKESRREEIKSDEVKKTKLHQMREKIFEDLQDAASDLSQSAAKLYKNKFFKRILVAAMVAAVVGAIFSLLNAYEFGIHKNLPEATYDEEEIVREQDPNSNQNEIIFNEKNEIFTYDNTVSILGYSVAVPILYFVGLVVFVLLAVGELTYVRSSKKDKEQSKEIVKEAEIVNKLHEKVQYIDRFPALLDELAEVNDDIGDLHQEVKKHHIAHQQEELKEGGSNFADRNKRAKERAAERNKIGIG